MNMKGFWVIFGALLACQPQSAGDSSGASAYRGEDAEEALRSSTLKKLICKQTAAYSYGEYNESTCLASEFTVTKKFFPDDDPDYISMLHVSTNATFDADLDSCNAILKRDWSQLKVSEDGNISGEVGWTADVIGCDGASEHRLTDDEYAVFTEAMEDHAGYYDVSEATTYIDEDACDPDTLELVGTAEREVDLTELHGSGEIAVRCPETGETATVEYCSIDFELDDSGDIDLASVEVTYCDY